ncbi:DUF2190 family protein [Roseococcus pinisoli]|uniref:DUF2190 family protein n=1 Tax=Roseococcus pinisoli TaxID=2835040 RepID=A0ABS5QC40_9PROT|nr:DUF2190 family protein [Roseococcus pinisoli]MBS7810530.1 DUF2190 family protein [Roseococcus pinisoli]
MKNFVQKGAIISVTAPAILASGQGCLVGDLFGVATKAAASGSIVEILTQGVVELPKASGAVNEGVRVFWDNAAGNVTTTAIGNKGIGWAVGPGNYGSGATLIKVKLGQPNATAA